MARDFSGSTQYLTFAGAPSAYPITIAGWANVDGFTDFRDLIGLGHSTTTVNRHRLLVNTDATVTAESRDSTSGAQNSTTAGTMSANTWVHLAGVFASTTSRTAYLNGTAATPNTVSVTPSLDTVVIGARSSGGTFAQFLDGRCAELCLWTAVLSAPEIAALASGINPRLIRPESLWGYWPLWGLDSPEPDWSGNARAMSLTGTPTFAYHAPVRLWMPTALRHVSFALPTISLAALPPNTILASTNLTGVSDVTNIDDDPDSPDANWATATSATAATDLRVGFPTPGA